MSRSLRTAAAALTVTACLAAVTSCGSGSSGSPGASGSSGPPRAQPLTEADLRSVLPSGESLRGFVAKPDVPSATETPPAISASKSSPLYPDSPKACRALVDFELDRVQHRPAASVRADMTPRGREGQATDFSKLNSVRLSSYSVKEASAVLDSLRQALPSCDQFGVYALIYGDQDARINIGPWSAPDAGDDAVAFTWTVSGIAMDQTVPLTVVRTGGVLTTYSGAVPADIPRQQHEKVRALIAGGSE
ncbi:hypothetical protein ACH4SP_41010 [Streptomyces sp. NPDC021093]|uniref:hypothetical protein n=1 Tax=Streptomyces sp. NPDC021093 TaxID=3365112 RepID=UPI0037A48C1D